MTTDAQNPFLPNGYTVPKTGGNYMRLQDGENKFRVLTPAVVGFEYWTKDNKPVRLKEFPIGIPQDIKEDKEGNPTRVKPWWSFVVWNYKENKLQILSLTQATIMEQIQGLFADEDWGDPKGYDLVIRRSGEGLETTYTVSPKPHTNLPMEAANAFASTPVDLNALFEGLDPFKV